jgi:hypothetical protein
MQLNLQPPDQAQLMRHANATFEMVESITIDSPAMFQEAASELQAIKTKSKQLDEQRKAITGPLDDAKKKVMDLFRPAIERLEQAETMLKQGMLSFTKQQEAERQKQIAEANRFAAEARARQEAEAAELKAKADAEARAAREAEEEASKAAKQAMMQGNYEAVAELTIKADQAQQAARQAEVQQRIAADEVTLAQTLVMPSVVTAEVTKAKGVSTSFVYGAFEVSDIQALIRYVSQHPEFSNLLEPNTTAIRSLIKAQRESFRVPGLVSTPTSQLAVRAKV